MKNSEDLRRYIRQALNENAMNFLSKEEETNTRQLDNEDKEPKVLGDPLDAELNILADELGNDFSKKPPVSVVAGAQSSGSGPDAGQHTPIFSDKTKLAERK